VRVAGGQLSARPMAANLRRTLDQLEKDDWARPAFESHVVTECHRLRRVPLGELTIEDLRLLIGQKIGLPHLLPLALDALAADPFAQGNLYAGDLLASVVRVPKDFWDAHAELRFVLAEVMLLLEQRMTLAHETLLPAWKALQDPPTR
jgi:hypothetical protein